MRLTLRTLLAYLDDTLPASEAKSMGEKLAESDPAQEIVERIKNVIRRRRLTVAPAANRIDANTLAEYLDNEITPELAEELERICLSSDVHLAEVSACHQILSLVLGEPPAAPEQALKRMHGLAKGDAGIPVKKPSKPAAEKPAASQREADETLRMGLPSVFVKDWANRTMIFAMGALACLLIVVASMQLLKKPDDSGTTPPEQQMAKNDKSEKVESPSKSEDNSAPELVKVAPKPTPPEEKKPETKIEEKPVPPPTRKTDDKKSAEAADDLPPPAFGTVVDQKAEEAMSAIAFEPPSTKVVPVGQVAEPAKGQMSVVLQREPKSNDWKRITGKADIMTNRPIVSIPGSKSAIATRKGVKVTAWGNIPEQVPSPPVQEALVEFHDHDTLDLDMTLRRGRILIASLREEPIVVRVRFEATGEPKSPESYWILRLSGANAEAMIDRWTAIAPGEPFFTDKDDPARKGPFASMACMALSGVVLLKTPTEAITLRPAPAVNLAVWLGPGQKLMTITQPTLPWLDPKFVASPEIAKVRNELSNAFNGKAVDIAVPELLRSSDGMTRRTAVRLLGAIDDIPGLLDALAQDNVEQRYAAVLTLSHWISLSPENEFKLYDLVRQRLKGNEPETFMSLLHGFSQQALTRPETYEMLIEHLKHRQIEIRELAAKNLYTNVPAGQSIPYDAADPTKREKGYQLWLKLIPSGKLPPAPKTKAAAKSVPAALAVTWGTPAIESTPRFQGATQPRNHFIRSHPLVNSRLDAAATISS